MLHGRKYVCVKAPEQQVRERPAWVTREEEGAAAVEPWRPHAGETTARAAPQQEILH